MKPTLALIFEFGKARHNQILYSDKFSVPIIIFRTIFESGYRDLFYTA